GPKPGFHQHELEFPFLPYITSALEEIERGEGKGTKMTRSLPIHIETFKDIIEKEVAQFK
ncbi:MAG: hypothetical protein GQ469_00835, partial [Methanosarcinales archaeon]|nr:hypothetical protein [Methanosarcinales archaeon]